MSEISDDVEEAAASEPVSVIGLSTVSGAGTMWIRYTQNLPSTPGIAKVVDVPGFNLWGREITKPITEVTTTSSDVNVVVRAPGEATKLTKLQSAVRWGSKGLKVVKVAGAFGEGVIGGAILGGRILRLGTGDLDETSNLVVANKLGEFSLAPKKIQTSQRYAVGKDPKLSGKTRVLRSDQIKALPPGKKVPKNVRSFGDTFNKAYAQVGDQYKLIPNRGAGNKALRANILDAAEWNFQIGGKPNAFTGEVLKGSKVTKVRMVPSAAVKSPIALDILKVDVVGYKPPPASASKWVKAKDAISTSKTKFKGGVGFTSQLVSGFATDLAGTQLGLYVLETDTVKGGIELLPGVSSEDVDKYVSEYVEVFEQQGMFMSVVQVPGVVYNSIETLRQHNVDEHGQSETEAGSAGDNPWNIALSDARFVEEQVTGEYGYLAGITAATVVGGGSLFTESTKELLEDVVPDVDTGILEDIGYTAEAQGNDDVADILLLEERSAEELAALAELAESQSGWLNPQESGNNLVTYYIEKDGKWSKTVGTEAERDAYYASW